MAAKYNNYSLYIPTVKKVYSEELIINICWKLGAGTITRIDFVPIMKTNEGQEEPVEDPVYRQAFIYTKSYWALVITDSIDNTGSYRMYPNLPFNTEPTKATEYWLLLKNKTPVPYATTTLNIHQLAHNNGLLETKLAEMETKLAEMEQENSRLNVENVKMTFELSVMDGLDAKFEKEMSARCFIDSYDNILKMMEQQQEDSDADADGESSPRTYIYHLEDVEDETEHEGKKALEICSECGLITKIVAYGWRDANDNVCRDCLNLPGMDYYEY
jgi:regulator of replication initiation timing